MNDPARFQALAADLPQLGALFRWFNRGKYLNRVADPVLWEALERELPEYQAIFAALGYELRVDGRGFAWFHTEEGTSTTNKMTRQLALLFMVIFDTQADAGKPLVRFDQWVIDTPLLQTVQEQHQDLLRAEQLDLDALVSLMGTAANYGFARAQGGHWQLLPAVCRYLDHYEALASQVEQDEDNAWAVDDDDEEDDGDSENALGEDK